MDYFWVLTALLYVASSSVDVLGLNIPSGFQPQQQQAVAKDNLDDSVVVSSESAEDFDETDSSEAVRLLAELYGRHLQNRPNTKFIPRPDGFYPANIPEVNVNWDLFRRDFGNDAIVTSNPEYIDLVRFMLTQRFINQNIDWNPNLLNSFEKTSSSSPVLTILEQQYLYYYGGLPMNGFSLPTRTPLPLSLQSVMLGIPVLDGYHDAQTPNRKN